MSASASLETAVMASAPPRNEPPHGERLDIRREGGRTHQLTVRLPREGRVRLDADVPPAHVEDTRIGAEITPQHPPHDAERITKRVRREDAAVQESVIGAYLGAKSDATAEHRAEVRDHDRRDAPLVYDAVDGDARLKEV